MSGLRDVFRRRLRISVEALAVQVVSGIGSGRFTMRSRYFGTSLVASHLGGKNLSPMEQYIFITGGVVSSLGKGLASAALGALLQARGYKVRLRKLYPYLN